MAGNTAIYIVTCQLISVKEDTLSAAILTVRVNLMLGPDVPPETDIKRIFDPTIYTLFLIHPFLSSSA